MLVKEGKFSVWCFLSAILIDLLIIVELIFLGLSKEPRIGKNLWWLLPFYFVVQYVYLRLYYKGFFFHVGIRSLFLGTVFAVGVFIIFYGSFQLSLFGLYLCVMSFFHYSEFLAIAWCNPRTLSLSSFLLNHSVQYNLAAVASWVEFFIEVYLIPDMKNFYLISYFGFLLCIIGEVLRKTAMVTGSTNFAHIVQTEKDDNHELITHGIYALCRHPSYVGWFYWSIGTQVLLLNPLCTLAYTIVSWRFFKERIIHEEQTLLYFFGYEYMNYQKSVGTGLPWIKGFLLED